MSLSGSSLYVFFAVERYDIKGKELLRTLEKHYFVDIGLRNLLLGYRDADRVKNGASKAKIVSCFSKTKQLN